MASVTLKNVCKQYDKVEAVKNADIEVNDREFLVLVGPSGCGKSTILRMIAGLEEISSGDIYISNRLINHIPPKDRNIAMVFQNYALYPHMTVYQNMAFGLKMRKISKTEIQRQVDEAARILAITDLLDRKPKALSGGQRQRVAVGRAIVRNPQVFLFDEPLSNLDAKLRVQMRTEISKLHKRLRTTMIYVTHDQVEAMTMGDRIVVLNDGIVQQVDKPLHLYNFPRNKFVAAFIGSPAMNFIEGSLQRESGIVFKNHDIRIPLPERFFSPLEKYIDKQVTVGIRPEDIHDSSAGDTLRDKAEVQLLIDVIEPMGNECYLHLSAGANTMVARVKPDIGFTSGEPARFLLDLSKIKLFDHTTEETIPVN